MLKRSIILGSLVAGVSLLPLVANAAVSGICSNCHTMHASQAGVTTTPQNTLLKATGCYGCHMTGVGNTSTGRDLVYLAPQVDGTGNTGYVLDGGYFKLSAADNTRHNVQTVPIASGGDHADANLAGVTYAPGGTVMLIRDATTPTLPGMTCSSCHGASGGHHGTASNYRLLSPTVTVTNDFVGTKDYGAVLATSQAVGHRAAGTRVYNAQSVNQFCASCHTQFHNGAGYGANESASPGTWLRHPTGNHVLTTAGPSIAAAVTTSDARPALEKDEVVVGGDGSATSDIVMCLSCHVAHGGPNASLLSFQINAAGNFNLAGDGTKSIGCETCHSYGATGM